MKTPKLSEKSLSNILQSIYGQVLDQKRFKTTEQTFIVDCYVPKINAIFEFDGPSHYTQTARIVRDENLVKFCSAEQILLVQIPYFLQFDDRVLLALSNGLIQLDYMETEYRHGFWDKKIVLPADFNSDGLARFQQLYYKFVQFDRFSVLKEIYESLERFDKRLALGNNPPEFLLHYPT